MTPGTESMQRKRDLPHTLLIHRVLKNRKSDVIQSLSGEVDFPDCGHRLTTIDIHVKEDVWFQRQEVDALQRSRLVGNQATPSSRTYRNRPGPH